MGEDYLTFQSLVVTNQLLMLFSVRGEAMTYGNSAGCNYVTGIMQKYTAAAA